MDDRNTRYQSENNEKNSSKKVWKTVGVIALALALAMLTVIIINL